MRLTSDLQSTTTYVNQILLALKLVHYHLLHVLQASHANVQAARYLLVRIVRKQAIQQLGQQVHDLVTAVEHAQGSAAYTLGELDDFSDASAQGQVHEVVSCDQAAGRGACNPVDPVARHILVPAVDDAEVVAA